MARRSKLEKQLQKQIAQKRVDTLYNLAEARALEGNMDLADRYIYLARKICMRYTINIPSNLKRRYCKHCYNYILPGKTGRIRIHRSKVITFCNNCKKYSRMPLD